MRKRLSWGAVLSLMIIVVAVTVCVTMLIAMRRFNAQVNELNNRQAMYSYVADVDNAIRQNYYGAIDEEALRRFMASGQISGIGDKYARYYTPEEYGAKLASLAGQATGFGIEVVLNESGQVVLSEVYVNSRAYSAGLQKGDVVIALNKTSLGDDPLGAVQEALGGNASIILTVRRGDLETAFELSSASYEQVCVESELNGTVGYLRVQSLTDVAPKQLVKECTSLKERGATSLVLDLRNVDGGSRDAAEEILSALLPRGLYGYYVDKSGTAELHSKMTTQIDLPTALLVNGKTAGEAELIAGALRQSGKVGLVGDTTAGRSMAQAFFPLSADNAAVCLTVGEYRLKDNVGWEGKGLAPDVAVSLTAEQEAAPELVPKDQDAQYLAAVEYLAAGTPGTPTTTTTTAAPTTTTKGPSTTTTTTGEGDATTTAGTSSTTTTAVN